MPKVQKPPSTSPSKQPQAPGELTRYLESIASPISELNSLLETLPNFAPQLKAHVATSEELSAKAERIKELETAMAAFDSVHMRASEALKVEVDSLKMRLEDEAAEVESLKYSYDKKLERMKLDHQQALSKLELEHSAAVASLEGRHQSELRDVKNDLDRVKREMEDVDVKNCGLRKTLDLANEKLRMLEGDMACLPDDDFEAKWIEVARVFQLFCKKRFTNVPEPPTNRKSTPHEASYLQKFFTALPFPLPSSDTQASSLLRIALVQHHISNTLCKNIFRTIVVPSIYPDASTIFESISTVLYRRNPHLESTWRSLTTAALFRAGSGEALTTKFQKMAEEIIDLTYPLIPAGHHDSVREELCGLFKIAFTTWRPTQRCSTRIFATADLSEGESWGEDSDQEEFGCTPPEDMDESEQQHHSNRRVLCLFPRVYREDQDGERHVYFPGTAMYEDSGAYMAGFKENRAIQNARDELMKKKQSELPGVHVSRRSRRLSVSRPLPQPVPVQALVHKPRIVGTGKALEVPNTGHQQLVSNIRVEIVGNVSEGPGKGKGADNRA